MAKGKHARRAALRQAEEAAERDRLRAERASRDEAKREAAQAERRMANQLAEEVATLERAIESKAQGEVEVLAGEIAELETELAELTPQKTFAEKRRRSKRLANLAWREGLNTWDFMARLVSEVEGEEKHVVYEEIQRALPVEVQQMLRRKPHTHRVPD